MFCHHRSFLTVVFITLLSSKVTSLIISSVVVNSLQNKIDTPVLSTEPADYRLPTSLYPTKYHLRLFVVLDPLPGFQRFTATCTVAINITCVENTNQIYLHAANLTISHDTVRVSDSNGEDLNVTSLSYEILNDFFIISVNSTLEEGKLYVVSMHYVAPIPDYRLNGMYQDFYQDPETSETRYLATTLFAPYHARRLFPSFDEPSLRAAYEVEIGHHKKYHAIANEESISRYDHPDEPDYVVDVFKTTPNISSYIAAMIVSDFTYEEAPENRFFNRTVRIYATPHLISLGAGEYAANITDAVMSFLEDRFVIKYPISKLYSIALPHFFFSAMENLGIITYKEPVVLYLKNETTEEERYIINSVMSHELSHQWFGNIVACQFWSWVWLKEGFSTFYSHYGINHTSPELKPWEMFVPKVLNIAMNFDSSNATHPLENHPPTSAAVADIYTAIPYNKGASINRMTSCFLTENVFEQAMKIYINKFQYSSAEQNDLFDSLQAALDQNPSIATFIPTSVREIMNSWTLQSGFPVINASRKDSSHIELSQKQFAEGGPSNSSTTWWVPIFLQPRSRPDLPGTVPDAWISQDQSSITVEITDGEAIIVNPDATGYYRVVYDDSLLSDIINLLATNHTKVPPTGRSKLIDDYFQLALSGYLPIQSAMNIVKYIHNDMSVAVWLTLQTSMDDIIKQLTQIGDLQTKDSLKEFLTRKISHAWKTFHLIINDDSESRAGSSTMLYELLIRWSCDLGSCVAFSEDDVSDFITSPEKWQIPKEKQLPFYCTAVSQSSSSKIFDYLLNEYTNPKTLFGRKQRLLKGLACTKDQNDVEWLIRESLKEESPYFSISESGLLLQMLAKKPFAAEVMLEQVFEASELFFSRYDNYAENILLDMAENTREVRNQQVMNLVEQLQSSNPERAKRIDAFVTRSSQRRALLSKSLAFKLRTWLNENE